MWNKTAKLLMVRVKVKGHWGFSFPVSIWVVDEFLEALTDLAWFGEMVIKRVPLPHEKKARQHMTWVKTISPSRIISSSHTVVKDLSKFKGLDFVDVEVGEVRVKVSLK